MQSKAASAIPVHNCPQGQPGVAEHPQPTAHKSVYSVVKLITKLDNLPWVNQKQTLANQGLQAPFYFIQNLGRKMQGLEGAVGEGGGM